MTSFFVELDARGDENALGFSLQFDPGEWSFVSVAAGRDAEGAVLHLNATQAARGRIGVVLALASGQMGHRLEMSRACLIDIYASFSQTFFAAVPPDVRKWLRPFRERRPFSSGLCPHPPGSSRIRFPWRQAVWFRRFSRQTVGGIAP
jgi:hypothetical protein